MNIESQALNKPTQVSELKQTTSASSQMPAQPHEFKSFKSELYYLKGTDQKAEQEMSTSINQNSSQSQDTRSFSGAGIKKQSLNGQNAPQAIDSKSFKVELKSIEACGQNVASVAVAGSKAYNDVKAVETVKEAKDVKTAKIIETVKEAKAVKISNIVETVKETKEVKIAKTKSNKETQNILGLPNPHLNNLVAPLSELESKIASIKELKSGIKSYASKSNRTDKDNLEATIDCQVIKMDSADAMFFVNLTNRVSSQDQNSPTGNFDVSSMSAEAAQGASKVSATLMDALSDSMKTNKPFRIDFDKDIAVILRVDKEGKVSAEFIPGDKVVEQYLKNNIPLLKERFEEQNLSYGDLNYKKHKQQDQEKDNNRKENKENDDE